MLMPEFTIRTLLVITAVCAIFSMILAAAVRGSHWAIGLSTPVAVFVVALLMQMAVHIVANRFSASEAPQQVAQKEEVHNPFATEKPPEQMVAPRDREW